jgi:hypothetical protein
LLRLPGLKQITGTVDVISFPDRRQLGGQSRGRECGCVVEEVRGEEVRGEEVRGAARDDIIRNGTPPAAAVENAGKQVEEIFAKYPIAKGSVAGAAGLCVRPLAGCDAVNRSR